MKKKIIIWGHKSNHTHSYIHAGYYKSFKNMGYETYWFDDNDDVSNFNFGNSVFLTEDQVQNRIPLLKDSIYILHHTKLDKYIDNNLTYINLGNYLKDCSNGISPYHKENSVEKINDFCYWDECSKTIYQPWATNLTPDEIDENGATLIDFNQDETYYIGTPHDNYQEINNFKMVSNNHNKKFIIKRVTEEESVNLIRKSFLSVDLRGSWHRECGYIPCRIMKNISYGRLTGTNSSHVKELFGDFVVFDEDISKLYEKLLSEESKKDIKKLKESINYIKENHTFYNRINNLMKFI